MQLKHGQDKNCIYFPSWFATLFKRRGSPHAYTQWTKRSPLSLQPVGQINQQSSVKEVKHKPYVLCTSVHETKVVANQNYFALKKIMLKRDMQHNIKAKSSNSKKKIFLGKITLKYKFIHSEIDRE